MTESDSRPLSGVPVDPYSRYLYAGVNQKRNSQNEHTEPWMHIPGKHRSLMRDVYQVYSHSNFNLAFPDEVVSNINGTLRNGWSEKAVCPGLIT